jgi:hypothetical protein
MVSDQERFKAWQMMSKEIDEVGRIAGGAVPGLVERLNVGVDGFYVVAPRHKTEAGLVFELIHTTSPNVSLKSLKIYPFFLSDVEVGWDGFSTTGLISGRSFSEYWRPMHQISFSAEPRETWRAMACVFIHELGHALAARKNGCAMTGLVSPLQERIQEETDMRTFDYRLMIALGGSAYQTEFDRGVYWMKRFRHKNVAGRKFPDFTGKGSALSLCLGPPSTPRVASERDFLFRVYCDLAAADRNLAPDLAKKIKCKIVAESMDNLRY